MNKILPILFPIVLCAPAHAADPAGFWMGEIELPSGKLGIEVTLDKEGDAWAGTITIPAQGIRDYGMTDVDSGDEDVARTHCGSEGRKSPRTKR